MKSAGVLVLIQIVRAVVSSSSDCSWLGFESCTGSLPILGVELAPHFTDSVLTDACSSWGTVKPCLDVMGERCALSEDAADPDGLPTNTTAAPASDHDHDVEEEKQTTSQASQELEGGYGFICESGNMNDYKREVRDCLTENMEELTTASTNCHEIYYNSTWWLNRIDRGNVYKFCSAAIKYLDCQKEAGQVTCGEGFATWVWSYHLSLWTPHLDDIKCVAGGSGMDAGALAIVTICCSAAGMAILFTIIALIKKSNGPSVKKEDIKRRPSSAKELSNGKSTDSMTELNRNGSVKEGYDNPALAPVPEHGILRQRHNESTKL